MLDQLFGIARNTYFESIRQPIVLVVLAIVTLALILANPLSTFTMENDQRMFIDIGLATVFVAGALLAGFVATGVLTREIDNRTALTVISKPVGRPMFVIGKFVGVTLALTLATLYMALIFLLVEQHTVLQTVRDPVNVPVVLFGAGALILGVGVATWCNYMYGMVFASTAITVTTPLLAVAYALSLLFDHDFSIQPIATDFQPNLVKAVVVLFMAVLVMTSIAVAISARLGQVLTVVVTMALFLLGLLSDWLIGRRIEGLRAVWLDRARADGLTETEELVRTFTLESGELQEAPIAETIERATVPLSSMAEGLETLAMLGWTVLYAIVPNFQVLWLSDALTQDRLIPMDYVFGAILYGACYIVGFLALAVALFQRREVG